MATIDPSFFIASSWTTSTITILASLIFFWSFYRLKERNFGLYIILVLGIADFIYPIINIIGMTSDLSPDASRVIVALEAAIYEFGLCWSTALAVLVSLVIKNKKSVNPGLFVVSAAVCCTLMAIMPVVLILTGSLGIGTRRIGDSITVVDYPISGVGNEIGYFMAFNLLGRLTPIGITFFCYYSVFNALKKMSSSVIFRSNAKPNRVLVYAFIQLACFLPGIFEDIYNMARGEYYPSVSAFLIALLHRSWGFLNLLAYWFLRPPKEVMRYSEDMNEMSLTLSTNMKEISMTEK